ncbi:Sec14p-like phosphatidylinositol transfer family protein [Perilla frutescens var. hirtella]|uniref:Sec14p-like phosphatidylinositol transfer family protein n=1 Tax=Perilla frutescens var. hirtella TaxID=608512 RepID=A0AAD4J286_PERFH|nr:Sec14p-like phosphatidylinositol transfer family protein [Perilla frutescens var. hirtella]
MAQCLGFSVPSFRHFKTVSVQSKKPVKSSTLSIRSCSLPPENAYKLVAEVKEKLDREYSALPVGKNGRDDEEMILWFLQDRNYSVKDAVSKLTKAIRWRHEFGVAELSEESIKSAAETGKAYVHDYLDVYDRPVLIANLSKHIPGDQELYEDEKLYTFMIEKALAKLPPGKQEILAIIDFRGFEKKNVDVKFLPFLFDTLYYYYPQRLSEVLFVDTPFMYMPIWQLIKPFLKSYADLVKFCSSKTLVEEYFTLDTVPDDFRN